MASLILDRTSSSVSPTLAMDGGIMLDVAVTLGAGKELGIGGVGEVSGGEGLALTENLKEGDGCELAEQATEKSSKVTKMQFSKRFMMTPCK